MSLLNVLRGLGAAAVALAGIQALLSWLRPWANCGRCAGRGWRRRLLGGQREACATCRGQGERLRPGRRLYDWAVLTRAARRHRARAAR